MRLKTWWELGEHFADGGGNPWATLACGFCAQRGAWKVVSEFNRTQPNAHKRLHFDTAQCVNCGNYILALWTTPLMAANMHAIRTIPYPLDRRMQPSRAWPELVGRYWSQAHDNLQRENNEMAIVAARTALQCAARNRGATGKNLKEEIDDLATKNVLPENMAHWAHTVIRDTGNDYSHPDPGQPEATAKEARDVVGYLDFLLEYVYDLPARIAKFRQQQDETGEHPEEGTATNSTVSTSEIALPHEGIGA